MKCNSFVELGARLFKCTATATCRNAIRSHKKNVYFEAIIELINK
jgi:hypothetical protein